MNIQDFIIQHLADDVNTLALQRNRYPELTDADFSFVLQQIEGRQRTKDKLPFLKDYTDWHFPKRLSTEQCSSELTARFKARLLESKEQGAKSKNSLVSSSSYRLPESAGVSLVSKPILTDLTGGMGIDILFMSEGFKEVHYVERNEELCELARHNFSSYGRNIEVHCSDATEYLSQMQWSDVIFIDPARRAASGKKVYRLEDCEPNMVKLMPLLTTRCSSLLIKLSPMLDLTAALEQLSCVKDVYVISIKNEVKEVLIRCQFSDNATSDTPLFHAILLSSDNSSFDFSFTQDEENEAQCQYATQIGSYLLEPDSAIMKAGAFRSIAVRYRLQKLAPNSHIYTTDTLPLQFPGRVWKVVSMADKRTIKGHALSVVSRNHPLSADQLRKKYHLQENTSQYLIASRFQEQPILILADRI